MKHKTKNLGKGDIKDKKESTHKESHKSHETRKDEKHKLNEHVKHHKKHEKEKHNEHKRHKSSHKIKKHELNEGYDEDLLRNKISDLDKEGYDNVNEDFSADTEEIENDESRVFDSKDDMEKEDTGEDEISDIISREPIKPDETETGRYLINEHKKMTEKPEIEEIFSKDERPNSAEIKRYFEFISKMKREIAKAVTGQEKIVDSLIMALLCDGHVLLEGVPGIAKTLSIKTLGEASGCSVKRIQFTVDLLPTDITGITTYTPGKGFETIKGPIFSNFVIADEINRSPSKTQSALIEAMQEMQVTIGKETFKLPRPFFVMATQNPLEQSGVYTLPEAQIDRFLFKLMMEYPEYSEEKKIMEENITLKKFEEFGIRAVVSPSDILKMQKLTKRVYLDDKVKGYILNIVKRTRTRNFKFGEYIEWGSSPRASIALYIASKARALMNRRNFVIPSDVKAIVHDVMRHRIILNYKARAEGVDSDKVINEILAVENI